MRRPAGLVHRLAPVHAAVDDVDGRQVDVAGDRALGAQVRADQDAGTRGQGPDAVQCPLDVGFRVSGCDARQRYVTSGTNGFLAKSGL